MSEALSLDTPVVVNKRIYGGWHYINEKTGAFFTDENDVVDVVLEVIQKQK